MGEGAESRNANNYDLYTDLNYEWTLTTFLEKPITLYTIKECEEFNKVLPEVSLEWYISGKYELPMIIYSDSGNYTDEENYLHSSLSVLPERRREEILKAGGTI